MYRYEFDVVFSFVATIIWTCKIALPSLNLFKNKCKFCHCLVLFVCIRNRKAFTEDYKLLFPPT